MWATAFILVLARLTVFTRAYSPCDQYKEQFSNYIGTVSECFSYNLSPISICGMCREALIKLRDFTRDRTVVSPSGVPCVDLLLLSDKSVIDFVSFVSEMWNRSFCSECLSQPVRLEFETYVSKSDSIMWTDRNTVHPFAASRSRLAVRDFYNLPVYNNVTVEFFVRLNRTLDCFASFIGNSSASILDILSFPAKENLALNQSACIDCSKPYFDLLRFYEHNLLRLNIEPGGGVHRSEPQSLQNNRFAVCADIQSALNRTQWAWAKLFDCRPIEKNVLAAFIPFIICIAALILFHALSYSVCQHPHQMLIYRPKRVEPRIRSFPSTSQMGLSTTIRDQLITAPSYGSMASSLFNHAASSNATVHHDPFSEHNCEQTRV